MDLFGARCVSCGRFGGSLCDGCVSEVALAPLPATVPGVDRVVGAYVYAGAARKLVLDLKLRRLRSPAVPLAAGMVSAVWRHGLIADALTWVPGKRSDIRSRGFDHAHVLASRLARSLGLPLIALLRRTGDRPDQTTLGRQQRLANLAGAFEAWDSGGLRVAVVDDLITTGGTAAACAEALRAAGATYVEMVTACQA